MDHHLILWPMAALAALTFIVLNLIPLARVIALRGGKARVSDFKLGESRTVPDNVRLVNRNFVNLLELPVLFYAICLILFVDDTVTPLTLGLAWAFVGFRLLHSLVHLTVNIVMLRLALFAGGATSLLVLWGVTFWALSGL